eukprot:1156303-Rhodomonas_salina.1
MAYLGYEMTLTGSWRAEIKKVMDKTAKLAIVLDKHKFTDCQGRYLFQCSAISTFLYSGSVGVANWEPRDLFNLKLALLWVRVYKNATHLSKSVARSLVLFPYESGGMQLITPTSVALKEVSSHLQLCTLYPDIISDQLDYAVQATLDLTLCNGLDDLQAKAGHFQLQMGSSVIILWVMLAQANSVKLTWDSMPEDSSMSWASVLQPIRNTDVHWSSDETKLRQAAGVLRRK